MHRAACGRASGLRGGTEVLGEGVSLCGGERRSSAGNGLCGRRACIAQPAGVRRRCVDDRKCSGRVCRCAGTIGSAREGCVAVRGRAKDFGGECVVRSAGLTHIRRSRSRARVLLYIRPPVHVVKLQPRDRKAVPAFTLPPHSLPRSPRSDRPSAAAVIHNGLSTEKLSTSLLTALCKTFSASRLRTRIYNISFARRPLPGSVRVAPGKRSRRCGPVSRVAERRVGEGEGKGGRRLAQQPAPARLRPCPCPLMGRITVRKGGIAQAIPAAARAFFPRQLVYGRASVR